jgi:hypothetical protein
MAAHDAARVRGTRPVSAGIVGGGIGKLTAALSLQDGATLAACVAAAEAGGGPGLTEALRRYEIARLPRTSRLQAMSTANKTRFHLPDGPEQRERHARISAGSTDWSFDAVAWIYEHDATVVAPQPDTTLA